MPNELPVVNCNYKTVKQQIKFLIDNPVKCFKYR